MEKSRGGIDFPSRIFKGNFIHGEEDVSFFSRVPNHISKTNLSLLKTSDFLKKPTNVRVLSFSGRPGDTPPSEVLPEAEESGVDT